MSKGRHLFKKTDLARVVRGVRELDLPVKCVRITADGQIEVEIGASQAQASATANEWADWNPTDGKTAA
jgi:hypothetical protein